MLEIDYAYISENMANISHIIIRTYEDAHCTECYTAIPFDPNPALPI